MKKQIHKILNEGKKYGYSNEAVAGELLGLFSVVRSCYWCDVPITNNDEIEELPEGRGEAHKKCANEWYGCQMAED